MAAKANGQADFSNLAAVRDEVIRAEYALPIVQAEPAVLLLDPATSQNPGYINATLTMARSRKRGDITTAGTLRGDKRQLREIFSKHVIRGWENVVNAAGKAVVFSVDNCAALLEALPDDVFDDIVGFATTASNFRRPLVMSDEAVADEAKN